LKLIVSYLIYRMEKQHKDKQTAISIFFFELLCRTFMLSELFYSNHNSNFLGRFKFKWNRTTSIHFFKLDFWFKVSLIFLFTITFWKIKTTFQICLVSKLRIFMLKFDVYLIYLIHQSMFEYFTWYDYDSYSFTLNCRVKGLYLYFTTKDLLLVHVC
jgi:hypothetical protein